MFPTMTELDQAHERHEDFAAEAIRERRQPSRASTIRRALGLRVIALGRRLVGEPTFELARSR
jgi:hypothetical protein